MRERALQLLIFVVFALTGCLDPYKPPFTVVENDVMVVDGFLNSTSGSVRVELTHALPLASDVAPVREKGATVKLVSDKGEVVTIPESSPGVYLKSGLSVSTGNRYMISIVTAKGHEYTSAFVDVRPTPPIEKLSVHMTEDGVQISVSTNDPQAKSKFYRWEYEETWEYTAVYRSDFIFINRVATQRKDGEGIYRCYRTRNSTNILIGSSIQLTEDRINEQPIALLPPGDQRTMVRYSTLVRQRVIGRDEYDYLNQLQRTTENVGGLFDPQPSQVVGNVTSKLGPVLGYFSAGAVSEKRMFLTRDDLPGYLKLPFATGLCEQDTICVVNPNPYIKCTVDLKNMRGDEVITGTIFRDLSTVGFLVSTPDCTDCRKQGGVTVKPAFW